MPAGLGQKILKSFGFGASTSDHHQHAPSTRLPGEVFISEEEYTLSEKPTNGTYPRLARLSDGSILASFTQFEHNNHERVLRVSRSTDAGQSFHAWGEVSRRSAADLDNMYLLEVKPGTILAAFRNHDLGPNGPTHFRITVCQSADGGKNWTYLSQAAEKSAPLGLWEPFMRIGRQGAEEVQLTYSQEFAPDHQCTMLVVSRDHGRTWSRPRCVQGERERLRDGMNGIASTTDSSDDDGGRDALVMVFETTRHGTFSIEAVVSYDDGASWGHRHEVYVPPRGHNAGAPQIASFADGSLAVVFMADDGIRLPAVEWPKRAAVKVVFASAPRRGTMRWSGPTVVSADPSFWPGVMAIDDHTVLATYDHHGPRCKAITYLPP